MLRLIDMQTSVNVTRVLVRVLGSALIILGLLFWTGNGLAFISVHMLLGILLVLSLWTLAVLSARAGEQPGFVGLAIAWGVIVPILGLTQDQLLPGPAHWVIKVLHLLVGLGAIGLAEVLARRSLARIRDPGPRPTTQPAHGG
jgi:hypothetical protein